MYYSIFDILINSIEETFIDSFFNLNKNLERLNKEKEKIIKNIKNVTTKEYLDKLESFEKGKVVENTFNSFRTLNKINHLNSNLRDCLIELDNLRKAKRGADLILENLKKEL